MIGRQDHAPTASAIVVLPSPGGPYRKMLLPGIDRRADLAEGALVDHHVLKRLAHGLLRDRKLFSDCFFIALM